MLFRKYRLFFVIIDYCGTQFKVFKGKVQLKNTKRAHQKNDTPSS